MRRSCVWWLNGRLISSNRSNGSCCRSIRGRVGLDIDIVFTSWTTGPVITEQPGDNRKPGRRPPYGGGGMKRTVMERKKKRKGKARARIKGKRGKREKHRWREWRNPLINLTFLRCNHRVYSLKEIILYEPPLAIWCFHHTVSICGRNAFGSERAQIYAHLHSYQMCLDPFHMLAFSGCSLWVGRALLGLVESPAGSRATGLRPEYVDRRASRVYRPASASQQQATGDEHSVLHAQTDRLKSFFSILAS